MQIIQKIRAFVKSVCIQHIIDTIGPSQTKYEILNKNIKRAVLLQNFKLDLIEKMLCVDTLFCHRKLGPLILNHAV